MASSFSSISSTPSLQAPSESQEDRAPPQGGTEEEVLKSRTAPSTPPSPSSPFPLWTIGGASGLYGAVDILFIGKTKPMRLRPLKMTEVWVIVSS